MYSQGPSYMFSYAGVHINTHVENKNKSSKFSCLENGVVCGKEHILPFSVPQWARPILLLSANGRLVCTYQTWLEGQQERENERRV
jgi:hypothetical protein